MRTMRESCSCSSRRFAFTTAREIATHGTSYAVDRTGKPSRSAHASISGSSGGALMSSPIATATSPSALMRSTNAACSAAPAGTGNPVVITRSPCPSHSHGAASSQACAHATCRPAPAWPATTRVLSSGSATSSATVMPIALSVGDARRRARPLARQAARLRAVASASTSSASVSTTP